MYTVKELIETLEKLPPNYTILLVEEDGHSTDEITEIGIVKDLEAINLYFRY